MTNPATTSDIEARWRPLTPQQTTNAEAYLDDAWAYILGRRPTLEADVTAGTVTTANVIRVVCAMVLRVMRNPDGKLSESVDDYKYTRSDLFASGLMHLTDDELGDISPGRRSRRSLRMVAYGEYPP